MAIGNFFSTVASFLPKAMAAPQLSFMDQVKMQAPGSSPAFAGPRDVAQISPEAASARVDEAYGAWDKSIGNAMQDPQAKAVFKQAMEATRQQAEQAGGRPFDKDVALAYNLAEASSAHLDQKGANPAIQGLFDSSLGYLDARKGALGK